MSSRHVLIPVLVYCEGLHDQMFIKHLSKLYRDQSSLYHYDVKQGDGGSPLSLVTKALKMPGSYEQSIVIFDNDRGQQELKDAIASARANGVQLTYFTPALEHMLLKILEPKRNFAQTSTDDCKKYFESKYMQVPKRKQISEYEAVFPKSLLDSARRNSTELDDKITIFEQ